MDTFLNRGRSLLAEEVNTEETSVKKKSNCKNLTILGGHKRMQPKQRGPHTESLRTTATVCSKIKVHVNC